MIFPTPNINGTSKQSLFDHYYGALQSVQAAIVAVLAIDVHGRDYPNPMEPWSVARREHAERLARLRHIAEDLEAICEHIQSSTGGR